MINKKKITIVLIVLFTINIFTNVVYAKGINIDAKAVIAMDSKSKIVLFEKNAEMIIPMASTTKIMTALVAINHGNLDKMVTISKNAANIRGSKVGYKVGENISMKELLYGLMFRSGNDAAIAIAEDLGGSVQGFAKLMNEYDLKLGAINTHFETPHGLDSDAHYCSAYDLALITAEAKENKLFNEIVGCKDVDGKIMGFSRSYHNINKILSVVPGANGVKTGSTGKAGKCLVTSVDINGHDVIFIVLNCTPRWKETAKLFKYVSENFSYKKLYSKNQIVAEVPNSKQKIQLITDKDIILPFENGKKYDVKVVIPKQMQKSVREHDVLGKVELFKENQLIYDTSLSVKSKINIRKWFFNK